MTGNILLSHEFDASPLDFDSEVDGQWTATIRRSAEETNEARRQATGPTSMIWFSWSKVRMCLILIMLIARNTRATRRPGPVRVLQPQAVQQQPQTTKVLLQLRGGNLGPIDGKTLATTLSALAGGGAICGALIPRTSMRWFGIHIPQDSLSNKYLHGIGASAATVAVSLYLAVTGRCSVEEAIAYGFVARLVSMTLMILTDGEKKVGMNFSMFGTMWSVLAVTVYCLLQGVGDPLTLTKIVSVVLGVHGLFLHTYPGVILRTTRIAVGPDPLAKDILSIDGGYMLASAVTTFLLARGLDPVKVAGCSAISFIPVLLKVFEVVEGNRLWGLTAGFCAIAVTVLMACIIVGTLH